MLTRNAFLHKVLMIVHPPATPSKSIAPVTPSGEKIPLPAQASPETESDPEREASATRYEAVVESNESGYGSGVGESWVSLKQ